MRADRAVSNPGVNAELVDAIGKALTIARARTAPRADLTKQILAALETIALDSTGQFASAVAAAREIYGVRTVDDAGIMPLFDALDQARIVTAASIHQIAAGDVLRAKVLRALSGAHQRLVSATTRLRFRGRRNQDTVPRRRATGYLPTCAITSRGASASAPSSNASSRPRSIRVSRGRSAATRRLMASDVDLFEAVVASAEVLDTVEHGDRDPPG